MQALRGVSLELFPGEVHALVGENGAGKSTLVKILAGVHRPDTGELALQGKTVVLHGPRAARELGVAVIHQHPNVFPDLNVAENVFIGELPRTGLRAVDRGALRSRAKALFESLGVRLNTDLPLRGLSIADQQLVEIAKTLSQKARVVVMDEATASLSANEVERLFEIVHQLRQRGVAILFTSHRLDEVRVLADRITVLRDGQHVITSPANAITVSEIVRHMVGRNIESLFPKQRAAVRDTVLEVRGLSRGYAFRDITFAVRSGEIVGFAGLVGSGRSEIARAIFGIDPVDSGHVLISGQVVVIKSPDDARQHGIAYVPEDRHEQGLILDFSIASNISLPSLRRLSRFLVVDSRRERSLALDYMRKLDVRAKDASQIVSSLSGGNQQKVVIAKWLATTPILLILDEPTAGIDIGAKAEVHRIMSDLAAAGMAIVLISSELPELLSMADRILVLHEGRIADVMDHGDATQERVMLAATGQRVA